MRGARKALEGIEFSFEPPYVELHCWADRVLFARETALSDSGILGEQSELTSAGRGVPGSGWWLEKFKLQTLRSRYPVFLALSFDDRFRYTRRQARCHSWVQRLMSGAMPVRPRSDRTSVRWSCSEGWVRNGRETHATCSTLLILCAFYAIVAYGFHPPEREAGKKAEDEGKMRSEGSKLKRKRHCKIKVQYSATVHTVKREICEND